MKGTEVKEETELEQARRVLEQVLGSPQEPEQSKPDRRPPKARKDRRVGPMFNGTIHIKQLILKVG